MMQLIAANTDVKDLFPTTAKWNVKVRGQAIRLVLQPCHCGIEAKYVYDVPVTTLMPEALRRMAPPEMDKQTMEHTYAEWHFHPTWWQKHILRHKLKPQLLKWLREVHGTLIKIKASEEGLGDLWEMLEKE